MIELQSKPALANSPSFKTKVNGRAADSKRLNKLRECCSEVESLFIDSLLKTLRKTIFESDLLPKSAGRNIYNSMFDQQVSTFLSQGQGIGLGRMLYKQLLRKSNMEPDIKSGEIKSQPALFPGNGIMRTGRGYKGMNFLKLSSSTFIPLFNERV